MSSNNILTDAEAFQAKLDAITRMHAGLKQRSVMELALDVKPHASDSISDDGIEYGEDETLIKTGRHVLRVPNYPQVQVFRSAVIPPAGQLVLNTTFGGQNNTGYDGYIISPSTSAPSSTTGTSSTNGTTPTTAASINSLGPGVHVSRIAPASYHREQLKKAQKTIPYSYMARLFVGNLPAAYNDADLCCIINYEFGRFGAAAGAVFRKVVGGVVKPYAIVQFVRPGDAAAALMGMQGVGIGIDAAAARPCRIEWSNRQ